MREADPRNVSRSPGGPPPGWTIVVAAILDVLAVLCAVLLGTAFIGWLLWEALRP